MRTKATQKRGFARLNESPSEKEGKCLPKPKNNLAVIAPSMKVPPKRKGNHRRRASRRPRSPGPSMKVPPKRKGNRGNPQPHGNNANALNESPSEKEGKLCRANQQPRERVPSMKVPPKRKGNHTTSLSLAEDTALPQ